MKNSILFLIVVFLSNIIQCITGFAGTVLAMPFSVMLVGFTTARSLLNALGMAASVGVAATGFKHINRREFIKIIFLMLPGIAFGMYFSPRLTANASALYKVLGGIVIAFAVYNAVRFFLKKQVKKPGKLLSVILIAGAGIIHGLFVCGGPMLVVYASEAMDDTDEFRSTLSSVWVILNSIILFGDIKGGLFTVSSLKLMAVSLLTLIFALIIGNIIKSKMSKKVFLMLTYGLMFISGLSLFVK